MQDIQIMCKGSGVAQLEELVPFQGNLKSLPKENYTRLKSDILEKGFTFPVFVWEHEGKKYLIDGHQRVATLKNMKADGFKIPLLPIANVYAPTWQQAKDRVLAAASVFGRIEGQGLYDFLENSELDIREIINRMDLPYVDIDNFLDDFYKDIKNSSGGDGEGSGADDQYTKKIQAPVYEPTGPKPKITDLYDVEKTNQLISDIDKADIPAPEKAFLRFAAFRHIIFNYENIAEYYAHSDKETQDLMERSALVIIDFNKAIENGFVRMSEEFASAYAGEHVDGEEE